jgi:membrane protein YdbS with pleckstrin-like domain
MKINKTILKGDYNMKFSKISIIITILTFLIFGVSVANLLYSCSTGESIPMSIGICVVMLGIFVACVVTAVKDAKRAALGGAGADDDTDDDDDYDDDDE